MIISPFIKINFILKSIVASLLISFFCLNLHAQNNEISFDKLTVEAGLSQSSVISISQDSMGFMWFGTKDGLNRYDGQQFEVFRNNPKDSTSITSSQNINALLTDSKGDLWVGTQNGLNKYLPETKYFIRFINHPNDKKSLSNNTIRCIYEDREGVIWIGTENGLNKILKDGKFQRFFCKGAVGEGLVNPLIKAIYQDHQKRLWVGTQLGLVNMSFSNKKYLFKTYFRHDDQIETLSSNDITSISEDLEHNLWLGTQYKGINVFDRTSQKFKHFNTQNSGICNNNIRKILLDRNGLIWLATFNGISIYDPSKHTFRNQVYNPENPKGLNQNSIYNIYQDATGSIWVGTFYGGVNVYHPNAIPFKAYKHYSYKNSLSSNIISAMVEDAKGNLWIGTEAEGLNYFDRATATFKNFKNTEGKNSLSSNVIKSISIDGKGNLWIAAYSGGVDYYNVTTGVFKNYKVSDGSAFNEKQITCVLIDHQNRLWAGTKWKGLFLLNASQDKFESLKDGKAHFYLPAINITYIYQDLNHTLWVATDDGVYYLSKNKSNFIKLSLKENTFLNHISVIGQTSSGKILFGSYNEGMAYFYPATKKLVFFTVKQGLPSNTIAGIIEDNQKRIWVSTDKGIAVINKKRVKVYNRNDGFPSNVFNYHSVLKDSKGTLFFGGYNGLISFNPSEIVENRIAPKVVFTGLKLFNQEININDESKILKKSLNQIDALVLNYQQNVFSVDFAVLNYVKSKKNKYAYKLEGYQKDWIYVDEPKANFTNLPDGTYHLLAKGSNNDGIWSNKIATLKIVIKPPFWKTWWAYLFYILILAGLFYLIIRFLLIRALLKREHDLNQMKLEFFTNVSHEIRTPLTLILGPLEKILQDTQENLNLHKQLSNVNKNAKRLMKLVNELMDFRKIESGKMKLNLVADNIVSFVQEIYLSFQQLAIQKEIAYSFKSAQEDIEVYFDKAQLEKVIFNLLANAFKFVSVVEGKIEVEISLQNDFIFIRIKDNGEGIPDESKPKLFTDFYQVPNHQKRNTGTGIGLALAKSIAKLHHGDLVLEDDKEFTCFCLSLKTGNEQYHPEEINIVQNINDSGLSQWYHEVDPLLYDEVKKKNSIVGNQPLLLVVDDNKEVKEFIVRTLEAYYQVISAENGLQALDLAFEKIPDVIISDVMMPEMDGFEFCANIKTDIRTRHIPVVLLTARSSDLHELEGLKTGADVYLTKPFNTQKLHLIVDNLLALQQNMRDKFSQTFSLEPKEVQIESADEEFLKKVLLLLEDNISNSEFNVNLFASEIGMSTPVFYKKIHALTGLTVNNFVKSIRLKRAFQLLEQKAGNVSEVAYMVGFNDAKYFSKEFKKQYGKSPSAYI